jgi:hypothetical protein
MLIKLIQMCKTQLKMVYNNYLSEKKIWALKVYNFKVKVHKRLHNLDDLLIPNRLKMKNT